MRALSVSLVLACAAVTGGCATSPETTPVQAESEAQRLVFGAPKAVRTQFASQIATCWFAAAGLLKEDYSFAMPDAAGPSAPLLVRVVALKPDRPEVFQVQFYPHNENTVVATRNISLPQDLAAELETSVQSWLLDPADCRTGGEEQVADAETRGDAKDGRKASKSDAPTVESDDEVDLHQAELRARGAIE